jgi:hypothetical protein
VNYDDIYDEEGEIGGTDLLDDLGVPEEQRVEAVKQALGITKWPTCEKTPNGEVYTFENAWKLSIHQPMKPCDAREFLKTGEVTYEPVGEVEIAVIRPNGKMVTLTTMGAKTAFHTFELEGALKVYLKGTDAPTRNGLQQVVENSLGGDDFDPDDHSSDIILNVESFDAENKVTENTYVGPVPQAPPVYEAPPFTPPPSTAAVWTERALDVAAVGVVIAVGVGLVKIVPQVVKAVAKGMR